MSAKHDTRNLSIVDILRARQLTEAGAVLDTQIRCTSSEGGLNGALLSSMIPLTSRHTMLARVGGQQVLGQFYLTHDERIARLVYLAPRLEQDVPDDAWLLILDAIVQEAGKRGAHVLKGEVDENSPLFTTMRQSGFAVYARQKLWALPPNNQSITADEFDDLPIIQRATEDHTTGIYLLYRRMVPRILQQVSHPPSMNGFVYLENGKVMGFIHMAEGRDGVMLTPYIDPKVLPTADAILLSVMTKLNLNNRLLTVRVQRHQGWLGSALESLGFRDALEQAVMVRHIAAGVHTSGFVSLEEKYGIQATKRQTGELPELCYDTEHLVWIAEGSEEHPKHLIYR